MDSRIKIISENFTLTLTYHNSLHTSNFDQSAQDQAKMGNDLWAETDYNEIRH